MSSTTGSENLYDVEGAAKFLCLAPATVYKMAQTGVLKGTKYGRVWRFTKENLLNPVCVEKSDNGHIQEQTRRKLVLSV